MTRHNDTIHSVGLLVLRLALSAIMMAHGSQKAFGWFDGRGLSATIEGFQANLGIPPLLTSAAVAAELGGGLCLALGIFPRLSALAILAVMLVAMFHVHWKGGFFLPNGIEFTLALGSAALCLALTGPGRIAIWPDMERDIWKWVSQRRTRGAQST